MIPHQSGQCRKADATSFLISTVATKSWKSSVTRYRSSPNWSIGKVSVPYLLDWIRKKECKNASGCKSYDVALMIKALFLQSFYGLGDDQTEYQIRDRYSFYRFIGLAEGKVPDAKTIWLFRESLKGTYGRLNVNSTSVSHILVTTAPECGELFCTSGSAV